MNASATTTQPEATGPKLLKVLSKNRVQTRERWKEITDEFTFNLAKDMIPMNFSYLFKHSITSKTDCE